MSEQTQREGEPMDDEESSIPAERAQQWLDSCRRSPYHPESGISEKVRVAIGSGIDGLYVGVTFLPGGTNGITLTWEECWSLEHELMYAAVALQRERERAR